MSISLPGTPEHQQILQTIIDHYTGDEGMLAIIVFGSLGRGDWDAYSDIDLDIVTRDDVEVDVGKELTRLCAVIQVDHGLEAIIIPYVEEGDVVLSNLVEFSIRYHPLHDTKSAILDSMVVLSGTLSKEEIQAAGEANRVVQPTDLASIVNQCIRYALEIHHAIMRERLWTAIELLHRIRLSLMELFATSQDGIRGLQFFEAKADQVLQERLKRISAQPDMASVRGALGRVLNVLEHDLGMMFSGGQYQLTDQQRMILGQIKERDG